MTDFARMTGAELVRHTAANAGAEGAGAAAELTRRQIDATEQLRSQMDTSGRRLTRLTWVLVVFTVVLIVIGTAQLIWG